MKINILLLTIFISIVSITYLISQPSFNGTSPGCSGGGCHTYQSGIVSAVVLSNNQVQITISGTTGNVAGELVNTSGTVVAVNNGTGSNPFTLTAPSAGTYYVNAGYKNPSRLYGTDTVVIGSAPANPSSLNANPVSTTQINLSWTDNSADETGFKIERKTGSGGTFAEIAQVGANVTSYNNSGLLDGVQYCYQVRAYNGSGNSGYSNQSCATTFPDTPSAPSNLFASISHNPLSVMLSWNDNSGNETGFVIERELVTDAFVAVDTVSANSTSYQDTSVSITTFRYRVKAINTSGSSVYSNVVEIFVPVELTSFTAKVNSGIVYLNWQTATELENNGFEVLRRESDSRVWLKVGFVKGQGTTSEITNYSYTDAPDKSGKFSYMLKQIDYSGKYEYSDEINLEVLVIREYNLAQNFPNPFNPSTRISFTLAADSKVSLRVFNILGQEVAVIVDAAIAAGTYNYNFDASKLNSGVYFYQLEAQGNDGSSFKSIKKMILTR